MKPFAAPSSTARRLGGVLIAGLLVGSGAMLGTASPAAAIATVTTSGTTMTVSFVGSETLTLTCVAGKTTANGQTGSPAVACNQLTKVTVNGDSGAQNVDGRQLEWPQFTADPTLVVNLGGGSDLVYETDQPDTLNLGAGNDNLYLEVDTTVNSYELGPDTDAVRFFGDPYLPAIDTVVASSSGIKAEITRKVGGTMATSTMWNAETIGLTGFGGNDVLDLSGIVSTSSITEGSIYAGDGDDTLIGTQKKNLLDGGAGTNSFVGGVGQDSIFSSGNQDTIDPKAGQNWVHDKTSGKAGRTITSAGIDNYHETWVDTRDSIARIRPGASPVVTHSLARPGQQVLPSSYGSVIAYHGYSGSLNTRGLFDVVALPGNVDVVVDGDSSDDDLLDVTIPTGSWTVAIANGSGWITPSAPGYAPIKANDVGAYKVHGPWTDKNKGFTHRSTRDLLFRFATDGEISTTAAALTAGTTTRSNVVSDLMDTDEYRGLDVDRVFTRYLNRAADPGGRTYWINSLRNGKALWRFRAQLFGSNEYFTKAGGTNEKYLDRVYFDVLGRLPDPSGRTYWTNKLNSGADRGSVALQFINSSEFRRFIVDDQFLRFLDRKATTAEQDTWAPKITGSAAGEQDLIAYLAASPEYYART